MTSHELAHKLLEMPDLPCTRRGYEGGVEIISEVQPPCPIHLNVNGPHSYMGAHDYCEPGWCSFYDLDSDNGSHPPPHDLAIHLS